MWEMKTLNEDNWDSVLDEVLVLDEIWWRREWKGHRFGREMRQSEAMRFFELDGRVAGFFFYRFAFDAVFIRRFAFDLVEEWQIPFGMMIEFVMDTARARRTPAFAVIEEKDGRSQRAFLQHGFEISVLARGESSEDGIYHLWRK